MRFTMMTWSVASAITAVITTCLTSERTVFCHFARPVPTMVSASDDAIDFAILTVIARTVAITAFIASAKKSRLCDSKKAESLDQSRFSSIEKLTDTAKTRTAATASCSTCRRTDLRRASAPDVR